MEKNAILISVILTTALIFTGCAGSTATGTGNEAQPEATAAAEKAEEPAKTAEPKEPEEATAEAQKDDESKKIPSSTDRNFLIKTS